MRDHENRRPSSITGKPPIDDSAPMRAARAASTEGCARLLRAQLRYGNHILPIAMARTAASAVGMGPARVRAAPSDPTITTEGRTDQ